MDIPTRIVWHLVCGIAIGRITGAPEAGTGMGAAIAVPVALSAASRLCCRMRARASSTMRKRDLISPEDAILNPRRVLVPSG
jgi:hypothetical protein